MNETLDKLVAFYSGMGTSIDGVDLSTEVMDTVNNADAVGADSINIEELINVAGNSSDNEVVAALNEITSAVEQFKQETAAKFNELINCGQFVQKVTSEMFGCDSIFALQQANAVSQIVEYVDCIKEREQLQPVVNNYHYDSLLTVNGNVDKEVLPDLQTIVKEACKYTKNDIYQEQRRLGATMKVLR